MLRRFGVQAPVSPNGLSNVNKQHIICISEELIEDLAKIHSYTNQVVCHGHTHGKGQYSDNFSLEDMAAYIMMNDIHPLMRNQTIQTV